MDTNQGTSLRRRTARLPPHLLIATIAAAPALWLSSRIGLSGDVSIRAVLAVLVVAALFTVAVQILLPGRQSGWRLVARVGVQIGLIVLVIYAIGWGPTMAIGLLFGVADNLRDSGSKATIPAVVVSVTGIVLGQVAIAIGLAPSLIDAPLVHGLAVLATVTLVITILMMGWTTLEKERAEEAARTSEGRFRALVQNATDIIIVVGSDRTIEYASPAFERVLGYSADETVGTQGRSLIHEDDLDGMQRSLDEAARFPGVAATSAARTELRLRAADGQWHWFDASVTNLLDDPRVGGIVANLRDIDERKAISERLSFAAVHDSLTGLANRSVFAKRLALALDRSCLEPEIVGVIFLDLDRFGGVNDSLGHVAADELLVVVAQRLRAAVRPRDVVARFGGDEFVVLCEEMSSVEEILQTAGRLAQTIARPVTLSGREIVVTASLGVALASEDTLPNELLRDADAAMYRAKELGRARVEMFDGQSRRYVVGGLETASELRHALGRGEFELHYQPIIELRSAGRVTGFEALIRWQHPTRGMVSPDEFIPSAEESGLIVPIGLWVLETACAQAVTWQRSTNPRRPPLSMSVNLAPRQLAERSFPQDLGAILDRTGIVPGAVVLELTESVLMNDMASVRAMLAAIRAQGVQIAVDDFGTGYSSLARLKRFPVRSLKIDQSFVRGLGVDPDDTSIVTAIISLAHSLGLVVVAEGIETAQQLAELRTLGCDYGQGFLFGRPKPAIEVGDEPADNLVAWQTATT